MTPSQQDQWYETMSAYLDSELSDPDRSKFESVLQTNPTLLAQLNELNKTRDLLRHAPRQKVPHNFTLTSSMLPQKKTFTIWFSIMRTSSALAAIAFIFTFLFNNRISAISYHTENQSLQKIPIAESLASSPAESAIQEAPAENSIPYTEEPIIIQWFGDLATGKGGGDGQIAAAPQTYSPSLAESALEAPMPGIDSQLEETRDGLSFAAEAPSAVSMDLAAVEPSEGTSGEQSAVELPAPSPTLYATSPAEQASERDKPLENPILGIRPDEEQGKIIRDESLKPALNGSAVEPDVQHPTFKLMVLLRSSLVIFSLLTGIFSIFLHSRKNV